MSAGVTMRSRVEEAFGLIREEQAKLLLAAGITLANEHQRRLSVGNPAPHDNPSKPGEYPKLRTGFGRAQFTAWPMSISEVAQSLSVTVGVKEPGWYLEHLAENRKRKGLLDTLDQVRKTIEEKLVGKKK